MKKPKDCTNIDEIREGIDCIDKQIVSLLGERLQYIQAIVQFKRDEEDVLAHKRYKEVLKARREWALNSGLDPEVIENMYKTLMQYFIEVQKKALQQKLEAQKQYRA
jgi:isochorismate pyruvate lyase